MSRIKNLYRYLIINNAAQVNSVWLSQYIEFTTEVENVREALLQGGDIHAVKTYERTRFKDCSDPWLAFAEQLIYKKENGISSRGQSVLSAENFTKFLKEPDFVFALAELVKEPTPTNFSNYQAAWEKTRKKHGANANPLLINRTLAACTMDVTSTVNEAYFKSAYQWLVREGILEQRSDPNADWYNKNVELMNFLQNAFAEDLCSGKTSKQLLSMFVWYIYENISNPFAMKKQLIKYGAPGTGKTYTARQSAKLLFDIWREKYSHVAPDMNYNDCIEVVQFHPSYGYEDFIEGLRPKLTSDGRTQLTLQNGVFKEFCRRAGRWEIEAYCIRDAGPNLARKWQNLTVKDLQPYTAQHLKHSSWNGIANLQSSEKVSDAVPPFFFIIDEINRAELSRVLGELMIALEYRGVDGAISTQYAALNTQETSMLTVGDQHKFFIPHNVYIIGTMNTIDRSVESFDLALRRRFRWERSDPDLDSLRNHLRQCDAESGNRSRRWEALTDDLEKLNDRILNTDILGADYQIGHAYLMNLRYPQTLSHNEVRESIWADALRPLLEEYLRGSGRVETLMPDFQKAFGLQK